MANEVPGFCHDRVWTGLAMRWPRELIAFGVGGVIGFAVDAGIVHVCVVRAAWNPYAARVLSFLTAACVTWLWNRHVTFAHRRDLPAGREFARWILLMSLGAAVNYGLYAALVAGVDVVHEWPALGVAAGSAVAALINFANARVFVFRKPQSGL